MGLWFCLSAPQGIPQVTLVGHDWGGSLVWNMAQFHSERVRYCISVRIINKLIQECHECWMSSYCYAQCTEIHTFSSHANHFVLINRAGPWRLSTHPFFLWIQKQIQRRNSRPYRSLITRSISRILWVIISIELC